MQELQEFFHIIIEVSEVDEDCIMAYDDAYPTLYYQHTYDKRTLRWFSETETGDVYPFDIPDRNRTQTCHGGSVPMINFVYFQICPQQAFVQGMMSVSDEEYISPNEVSARRLEESAAYFAENMADATGRRRSSALGDSGISAATSSAKTARIDGDDIASLKPQEPAEPSVDRRRHERVVKVTKSRLMGKTTTKSTRTCHSSYMTHLGFILNLINLRRSLDRILETPSSPKPPKCLPAL